VIIDQGCGVSSKIIFAVAALCGVAGGGGVSCFERAVALFAEGGAAAFAGELAGGGAAG
jgi:hypothetical protein